MGSFMSGGEEKYVTISETIVGKTKTTKHHSVANATYSLSIYK